MNLINQLRSSGSQRKSAMSLFGLHKTNDRVEKIEKTFNPFTESPQPLLAIIPQTEQHPERLDSILENSESQIKLGLAHDRALDLLNRAVDSLAEKLDDVRADRLPSVISAASKTVESIRKERIAAHASGSEREVHFHFYTPEQKKIEQYEIIDVA